MATATVAKPTFSEKRILAEMERLDTENYLTMNSWEVEYVDITNYLDEIGDESIQDRADDFLEYKRGQLRDEAIAELTEEAKPAKQVLQERLKEVMEFISRYKDELKKLKTDIAAL
jgi:disulfide oxidoreductase YuzD